ncbi:MAG: Cobalt transporter component CbiQ [Actinobacteria bacterium]|nr:Cobalt transporter component CbiQ [Actinomycetota bacterium]
MTPESPAARERSFLETARERHLRPVGRNHLDKTLREISSFFSRSMFREETARRDGLLQKVDPRARLIALIIFLASTSVALSIPALVAHASLPVLALGFSRIRVREFLGGGFLFAILFSVSMAAPSALNLFSGGTVVYPLLSPGAGARLGPWPLPEIVGITREGLLTAATFLLRVLSSTAAVLWLTLSTRWVDLLRALRFLRLPPFFLQVTGMTVRYIHALLLHSEEIHLGKKSRSVCRATIGAEQGWAGSRIAYSWEKSLHLMEEVGAAMRARGFTGEAKFPSTRWFGAKEWTFLALVFLACAGGHFA